MWGKSKQFSIIKHYIDTLDTTCVQLYGPIWIRSNKDSVLLTDFTGVTLYAVYLKTYYMTLEFAKTDNKKVIQALGMLAEVAEQERLLKGLVVQKYEFWLPSYLYKNVKQKAQFIGSSIGVSFELACEFLSSTDKYFAELYDKTTKTYMSLPLFETLEEAENFNILDITQKVEQSMENIEHLKQLDSQIMTDGHK